MAAVEAAPEDLQPLLADPSLGLTLANLNAPRQAVISGPRAGIERAESWCTSRGLQARPLPVSCAFHSPLVAPAQRQLAEVLRQVAIRPPRLPVFSNTTAARYPEFPPEIVDLLSEHLVRPVRFVDEVRAMYEAGARVFVEVGPRAVLSGLVGRILESHPHVCIPLDKPGRHGLVQWLHGLAALAAEGVPVQAVINCSRAGRSGASTCRKAREGDRRAPAFADHLAGQRRAGPAAHTEGSGRAAAPPPENQVIDDATPTIAPEVGAVVAGTAPQPPDRAGGNSHPSWVVPSAARPAGPPPPARAPNGNGATDGRPPAPCPPPEAGCPTPSGTRALEGP